MERLKNHTVAALKSPRRCALFKKIKYAVHYVNGVKFWEIVRVKMLVQYQKKALLFTAYHKYSGFIEKHIFI